MKKCNRCGSYAVNPGRSGRDDTSDLDLCDVCYWRKRAEQAAEIEREACARLCDTIAFSYPGGERCAALIRARGAQGGK